MHKPSFVLHDEPGMYFDLLRESGWLFERAVEVYDIFCESHYTFEDRLLWKKKVTQIERICYDLS